MSRGKVSSFRSKKFSLALYFSIVIVATAACASTSNNANIEMQSSSGADLIDAPENTGTEADAALFADLNTNTLAPPESLPSTEPVASALEMDVGVVGGLEEKKAKIENSADAPFYLAIGGESIGRVAYSLFGTPKAASHIYEKNPELKGVQKLSADQKIYFDLEKLNPEPAYLTKNMIEQYKDALAEKLVNSDKTSGSDSISVAKGDTLQSISQRLYGTTRYWTELYLLNKDQLDGYDKLMHGTTLKYNKRSYEQVAVHPQKNINSTDSIGSREVPTPNEAISPAAKLVEKAKEELNTQQPPVNMLVEEPVENPPPASVAASVQIKPNEDRALVPPVRAAPPETMVAKKEHEYPTENNSLGSSATNTRRIIYVGLILAIALAAFYMTRPSKNAKSFDMLNVTAENNTDSGISNRPKLHEEPKSVSSQKDIG